MSYWNALLWAFGVIGGGVALALWAVLHAFVFDQSSKGGRKEVLGVAGFLFLLMIDLSILIWLGSLMGSPPS